MRPSKIATDLLVTNLLSSNLDFLLHPFNFGRQVIDRVLQPSSTSAKNTVTERKFPYDFLAVVLHRGSFRGNAVGVLEIGRQDIF